MSSSLRRTPLHAQHVAAGARMVEFAGYDMPVHYSGILEEHEAVRTAAGLFDVSHMSNLWVTGPDAAATLSKALVADVGAIPMNGTKYTAILRDDGTIIDDLYVFHVPKGYHVVPNAGLNETVAQRIRQLGSAPVEDVTSRTAILALQGPASERILEAALGRSFSDLKRFHLTQAPQLGADAFISRTGYTGEDGFELVMAGERAPETWDLLLKVGKQHGLVPVGLGARDTLRLEKGFCLAGNEFAGGRTPLEAGLGWLIHWDHEFAGKAPLVKQKAEGAKQKLVALRVSGKGIPRHGMHVSVGAHVVGVVTSGTMSPMLKEGIALAYVDLKHAAVGTALDIIVREKPVAARVVKLPFV
ncbi:MAG TPA: glycine cleavage system aminomethyltransferase GcvT [Candidatus Thermoplasmatota archaeon]|nr:glycine cleavage system aminomethyltransferase GcvT [Candidatus Thermoplasmatota archaeon]